MSPRGARAACRGRARACRRAARCGRGGAPRRMSARSRASEHHERERLREEVVGAGVERLGLVVLAVLGGEDQDRRPDALVAQRAAHLVAVDAGEEDVEHDGVVRALRAPARGRRGRRARRRRRSPRPARPSAIAAARCSSSSTTSTRMAELCRVRRPDERPRALRRLSAGASPARGERVRLGSERACPESRRRSRVHSHRSSSLSCGSERIPVVRCAPSIDPPPGTVPGRRALRSDTTARRRKRVTPDMTLHLRRARPPGRPRRRAGARRASPSRSPSSRSPSPTPSPGATCCGKAKTGSGKTLAFGLPMLARIGQGRARAVPAASCSSPPASSPPRSPRRSSRSARRSAARCPRRLRRRVDGPAGRARCSKGVDVVVGTPGRLIDLIERGELSVGRRRGARRRRGRPHGRHGLHAAGAEDPLPHRVDAPDDAVLGHARRRGRSASSTATCTTRSTTRSRRTSPPSTRWSTASSSCTRWTR